MPTSAFSVTCSLSYHMQAEEEEEVGDEQECTKVTIVLETSSLEHTA